MILSLKNKKKTKKVYHGNSTHQLVRKQEHHEFMASLGYNVGPCVGKEEEEEDEKGRGRGPQSSICKGRKPPIQILTWNLLIASVLAAN